MKDLRFSPMAAVALFVLSACNDGGPTSPIQTTSPLVGEWHGTISYTAGGCEAEEIDVSAITEGEQVRLDVPSRCYGDVVLRLSDSGQAVHGNAAMRLASCTWIFGVAHDVALTASVSGTVSSGQLHLETTSFTKRSGYFACNRTPATLELVR